ncbi:MAG: methyltransferase domain-containing protein [Gaiellales bacterium]
MDEPADLDAPGRAGRAAKAAQVWERFEPHLRGRSILDVGADRCHLREHLDAGATYWGIGLGGTPDQEVNLEAGPIPFGDRAYDTVVCLDVLEHLANPHATFDELCRVARETVIVSLPNPWADAYRALRHGRYRDSLAIKYYGLPPAPPGDRHKWFFAASEARSFVAARALHNGFDVVEHRSDAGRPSPFRNPLRTVAEWLLFRAGAGLDDAYAGTQWFVLARIQTDPTSPA